MNYVLDAHYSYNYTKHTWVYNKLNFDLLMPFSNSGSNFSTCNQNQLQVQLKFIDKLNWKLALQFFKA